VSVTEENLFQDLEAEPSDRGVPLANPFPEKEPEEEGEDEPKEVQEEAAEGLESEPEEVSETVDETTEETQAEGPGEKLRAKDFADQAGWTLEEFYRDVTVPTDDGEVTLSEVVDGYKSLRSENEDLRNERQQLEAKATQVTPQTGQYDPDAVTIWQEAQSLRKAFATIQEDGTLDNMDANESIKLERKYRYEIEKREQAANHRQAEHLKTVESAKQEYLGRVDQQLRKDIPEWRSDKIRGEETEAIANYLSSEGAERAEIEPILKMNPWATKMFRKLWQYERKQADTKKALREIKKVPRSLKPGARTEAKKPSLKEVGKKLQSVKSRRGWNDTLMNAEFDDAMLK